MGMLRLGSVAIVVCAPLFCQTSGITITSPANGTALTAGQSVSVVVAPVGTTAIKTAAATFVPILQFPPVIQSPPFQTTLQVPAGVVGPVTIAAFATDAQGDILSATVTVLIGQTSQATAITVSPAVIPFSSVNSQPAYLSVSATFENGSAGYVTAAPSITYTSSNTNVATVSATGQVQPVGPGQANIQVAYGGFSATVPVTVGTLPVAITVGPSISGPSVSLDGLLLTSTQTLNLLPGSTHTISAVSPQASASGTQFAFTGWSDGGAATHSIVVPSTATSYLASFGNQYLLTTSAGTGGAISPITGYYNSGSVTVTASPAAGYVFTGFSGALTGTTNPQTLNLSGPLSVNAAFAADQPVLSVASAHTGSFTQGQTGATYTVTVSNALGSPPTTGTVTVTETLPAGLTLVSMAGTGWNCSGNVCTRSDALTAGASYPVISVTVNVSSAATAQVTNQVVVSGGGSAGAMASDPTTVSPSTSLSQTITFGAIGAQDIAKATLTISATASSGLTVVFASNSLSICTVSVTTVTFVAVGTCSITASQPGNANYTAATPVTQTFAINPVHGSTPSSVSLSSSSNPAVYGHSVTLTSKVTPASASGSVNFFDGATIVGSGVLSGGTATFTTSLLASGAGSLKAFYVGDLTYGTSISATIIQKVNPVAGSGFQAPKSYSGGVPFVIADLNGDGKPDVVFVISGGYGVGVALGNGDGTFQSALNIAIASLDVTGIGNPIGVADFNGDGKPDIACTGFSGAVVLLGNGDGTFQKPMPVAAGGDSVVIADYNGDGHPDLAMAGVAGVQTLLGIGDGTFQSPIVYSEYFYNVVSAVAGDFNGDGKTDVAVGVLVFNGAGYLSVQLGNGDGTFQDPVTYSLPGYVTSGDFNGDGKLDLAVANGFGTELEANGLGSTVSVLLGNGDGTFRTPVSYPSGGMYAVATGDFNGDGRPDLVGAIETGTNISLLLGNGDGTFQNYIYYLGATSGAIAVADFNGDGRADVALSGALVLGAPPGAQQPQTITFGAIAAQDIAKATLTISATSSSGLTVVFASNSLSICTVSVTTVTFVAVGTCSITAIQPGNANYLAAAPVTQTFAINPVHGSTASSISLSSSANPAVFGHSVTLTSKVTPASATGSVTLFDGATILGTGVLNGGTATFTTSLLAAGGRPLKAFYVGDLTYAPSVSATIIQKVNPVAGSGFQAPKSYSGGVPFVIADLNGDGKPDVVFVISGGYGVGVALGNGDGTFQSALSTALSVDLSSIGNPIGVADFNGDGKPDIACTGFSGAVVLLGNGDGTFQKPIGLAAGGDSLIIADFNGDGHPDLAFAGVAGVTTLLGIGDGTFQSPIVYLEYFYNVVSAVAGDFNGDGKTDLAVGVLVFNGAGYLSVQLGNGDGTFQDPVTYSLPGYVTSGDFNGDGKLDLAVANGFGTELEANGLGSTVSVLLGNGDGTFRTPVSYPSGGIYAVATGDFNGDGKPDLVGAIETGTNISVMLGNGDGTFQNYIYYLGASSGTIAVADFNGDGRADVALSGAVVLGAAPAPQQSQTITFGAIAAQGILRGPLTLTVTASSGLNLTLVSNSPSVCTVSGGVVTFVTPGTCSITASQPGNANYSAAAPVTQTFAINPVHGATPSSVSLSSSANTTVYGRSVTLTATVNPAAATGSVSFYDGVTLLGSAPLSTGTAVFATSLLASGTRTLKAVYIGDPTYAPSTSATLRETVSAIAGAGFKTPVSYGTGSWPTAVGDFDGDGKVDLVAGGTVLLGNGDGTFRSSVTVTTASVGAVTVGDFNGDGKLDIAFAALESTEFGVLLGNGDGTFQTVKYFSGGNTIYQLAAGDFNGDGNADIAVGGEGVSIVLGYGDGTFQSALESYYGFNTDFSPLVVGDFNGDGKADLAVLSEGADGGLLYVLLGNGDGSFQTPIGYTAGNTPAYLTMGDFNGDGKVDLAATSSSQGVVSILLGNGDGTFGSAVSYGAGTDPGAIATADFNGDGKADLVVTNSGNNVSLLLGNGDGTFQTSAYYAAGVTTNALVVGDFNGDGRPDLAVGLNILLGAAPPNSLGISKIHTGSFATGQTGATYSIVVSNTGSLSTSGAVTVTDTLPSGLQAIAIAGTGWACTLSTLTCSRSDSLATSASYPAITVTVNVSSTALASVTNTASVSGSGAATAATSDVTTITGGLLTQAITFGPLGSVTFGPTSLTVAATASSGLAVTFTSTTAAVCTVAGSSVTLLSTGTCSLTASQAGNSTYASATPVMQTFTVLQGMQTISFAALPNVSPATAPFSISASASSGLTVSFASGTSTVCTVSGSIVTVLTVGTCSVTASQAGNVNWSAATPVTQSFAVTNSVQSITFGTLGNVAFGVPPFTISATATSGLPVSFTSTTISVCTVSGTTVTIVATGNCSITATQAGNGTVAAASPVTRSFTVNPGSQTITFNAPPSVAFGSAAFSLNATVSSGLAASFASTTTAVCTVSGGVVTLVLTGTCSITASQPGNSNYAAAASVSQSFSVTPASQTISFGSLNNVMSGTAPFSITATASSGLTVTFTSNTPSVCTVSGSTVILAGLGSCSITATQAGNANYSAAPAVTQTFTVANVIQTITFAALGNVPFGTAPFAVTATASSGLTVALSSATTAVCTVSGNMLTILAVGVCSITATQPGNATIPAANPITQSFSVTQAAQTISFATLPNVSYSSAPIVLSATASSNLAVSLASTTPSICTVTGTALTLVTVGTCSVAASQAGNANYAAATPVTRSFTVTQASQTLTFGPLATVTLPASAFTVSATASSGLAVSFASTTTSVCTVSGVTVTPVAAGTCSIVASQAGNANYAAATSVTQSFTINPAPSGGGGGGGGGGAPSGGDSSITGSVSSVTISAPVGGGTASQTATFQYQTYTEGAPSFTTNFTVNQGLGWLSVSPTTGTMTLLSYGGFLYTYTATITITGNSTGIASGSSYMGNVNFSAGGGLGSVAVTMNVTAPPTVFNVAPALLSFSYKEGDSITPPVQSIGVFSNPAGASFTPAVGSGASWLSVGNASGTTPGSVGVSVNVAGLSPGIYKSNVTITPTISVPVTLTVVKANAQLSVSQGTESFVLTQGGAAANGQIAVANSGGGTLQFLAAASSDAGWLTLTGGGSGSATPSAPASVGFIANPSGLGPGVYSGHIVVNDVNSQSTASVPVTLAVSGAAISLSQAGMQFAAVLGGAQPAAQTFTVTSSGPWTATASSSGWLKAVTSGAAVTVSANANGLAAGTYYGSVSVGSQIVSVVLSVTAKAAGPGVVVSTGGLLFTSSGQQSVTLFNPSAASISYGASVFTANGVGWLSVGSTGGTAASGSNALAVSADFTKLTAGVQSGTITLSFGDGSSASIQVVAVVISSSHAVGACSGQIGVIRQPLSGAALQVASPQLVSAAVVDSCGNAVSGKSGGAVQVVFSDADAALDLHDVGGGIWEGTWTPANAAAAVTAQVTGLNASVGVSVAATGSSSAGLPTGVANAASAGQAIPGVVAPMSYVAIYGTGLAGTGAPAASSLPLPTVLNGTQLLLGGLPMPLLYASAGQVNALVPEGLAANASYPLVVVRGGTQSVPVPITVAAEQPGIYTVDTSGSGAGIVTNALTGALINAGNPAHAGDYLVVYCTGLGVVRGPNGETEPGDGVGAPSNLIYSVAGTVTAMIGGVSAPVAFAGLTPTFAGLYQVNVQVPRGWRRGIRWRWW